MTAQTMGEERVELRLCYSPDCPSRLGYCYHRLEEGAAQAFVECFDCRMRGPMTATYVHADQMTCERKAKDEAARLWNGLASLPLAGEVAEKGVDSTDTLAAAQPAGVTAAEHRIWLPHRDYSGAPMPRGVFRDPPEEEGPTATQADRAAAANLYIIGLISAGGPDQNAKVAARIIAGQEDGRSSVLAFARHRQANPTWIEAIEAAAKCADTERDEAARYAASMTGLDARECEQARIDSARKIATAIRNLAPKAPE